MRAASAHLRRRALKRRSSSTYEASGCASVTSASSAFSAALQLTAICASCKPTPLCSDGCGAAAVHIVCRGSCGQCTVSAQGDRGFAPDRLIGHGHTDKERPRVHVTRARACVAACFKSVHARWQHATCDKRRTACANDIYRATCNGRHPHSGHALCVADAARSVSCSELQRDECGAAEQCRFHTLGIPPPPLPPPPTHTPKKTFPQQCRGVCGASAEIGFEWEKTNARVHTMSTSPKIDVLCCEHWHHWADRRVHGEGDAPRPSPDVPPRPATPNFTVGRVG